MRVSETEGRRAGAPAAEAARSGGASEWRRPGAVLLVSCYELGRPPLALASPLAFLERAGFAPRALDLAVEPFDPDRVRAARLVAISAPMHTALRLGVRVAERARELRPDVHLCFYGLYAALNAEHLLSGLADSVIAGEFEGPLVALAEALERGDAGPVPGVTRRGPRKMPAESAPARCGEGPGPNGRPAPAALVRLDFPAPRREALPPLSRYARLDWNGEQRLAAYVETTRGCKHLCRHCPIPPVYGGRFFALPREIVLEDLRRQVRAGARHVTFGDPDFLNGPTHALRIVRAMQAEFPGLTFDFTAKIEHLLRHRRLLPELRELGALFVVSAVESLSDRVLAELRKGHTRADVGEALAACRAAGLVLRPSLVPFTPWATLEDYLELLEWAAAEALVEAIDPVQFSIRLLIPPGSALLEGPEERPWLGPLDAGAFSYVWRHPDPRMDRLQEEIARLVEAAAAAGEPAPTTFLRIRERAYAEAGRRPPPLPAPERPGPPPPRLTESWFC